MINKHGSKNYSLHRQSKNNDCTLGENGAMMLQHGLDISGNSRFESQGAATNLTFKKIWYKGNMSSESGKNGGKGLVGPEVVANIFGVSRNTVLNWARDGKIPSVRIEKTYRFSLKIISEAINHPLESM